MLEGEPCDPSRFIAEHFPPAANREGVGVLSLNEGWEFRREDETHWKPVRVPSTFEDHEGVLFDGVGWYRKALKRVELGAATRHLRAMLRFQGAATKTTVWCNGELVAEHLGGWTPFVCDISKYLFRPYKEDAPSRELDHGDRPVQESSKGQALIDSVELLVQVDELVGHNHDRFDLRVLRTRCILQGVLMFPKYRTFDTLKKARKYFAFTSNKLDYLGQVLEVGRKLDHEGIGLWRRVQEGATKAIKKEALKEMVNYCIQDVVLLEDVFNVFMPYVDHNTNHAVLKFGYEGRWRCPECGGSDVKLSHTDTTPLGYIKRYMKCSCKKTYNISNRTYQQFITKQN